MFVLKKKIGIRIKNSLPIVIFAQSFVTFVYIL